MDLDELKEILKIDADSTAYDVILTAYKVAAEEYLLNAGVKQGYTSALYKTVVTIFCGVLLQDPTLLNVGGRVEGIALTYNALVGQLKYS